MIRSLASELAVRCAFRKERGVRWLLNRGSLHAASRLPSFLHILADAEQMILMIAELLVAER